MTTATPSYHAVARWLITTELGNPEGALVGTTTAERVFQKLSHRVAGLITPVGCEALLARAVRLSRAGFPVLEGVEITRSADAVIVRLCDGATGMGPAQACEGLVALLGSLIALLVTFIGEDLTFRVLRDVWPDVPLAQPVQPIQRNGASNMEMTPRASRTANPSL